MRYTLPSFVLAGALALSLGAGTAFAQDDAPPTPPPAMGQMGGHHGHAPNAKQQLKHLTRMLGLTADQQAQVQPILETEDQKMKALWQDDSLSPEDRRSQMMQLHRDSRAQLEAVLTDAQKQKYEQMEQERQQRMRQWREQHPPESQPQA